MQRIFKDKNEEWQENFIISLLDREKSICKVIVSNGLARLIKPRLYEYSNLGFGDKLVLGDDFTQSYRQLFPTAPLRQTPKNVKKKLEHFIERYGWTESKILSVTKYYIQNVTNMRYCFKAGNFISKMENGVEKNPILEIGIEYEKSLNKGMWI